MSGHREDTGAKRSGRRLDGLDGLRGIAALLVSIGHISSATGAGPLLGHAYLAVDMFFMLSGYVIARQYEARMASGLHPLQFLALRLKRLWPTMAIGAAIGLIAFSGDNTPEASLWAFAMALLFIPISHPIAAFPTNPPAWSICFELVANLFHAVALRFIGIVGLSAIAGLSAAVLIVWAPGINVSTLPFALARLLFSYCAGILIWRVCGERTMLPAWAGLTLLPAAIVMTGVLPWEARLVDMAFVFLLCPIIVLSGIAMPIPAGRFFRWLGAISFPLYAVHYPVAMVLGKAGFGAGVMIPAALLIATLTRFVVDGRNRRPPDVQLQPSLQPAVPVP